MKKAKIDVFRRFESIKAFAEYCNKGTVQKPFVDHQSSQSSDDFSFYGTKNYSVADMKLLFGDHELLRKIEQSGVYETEAKVHKYMNRRQFVAAHVGFMPHVSNYVAGAPNAMINMRNVRVPQPVITIGYNTAVSGGISADEIITATCQMVSAIIILEAKGYRVNFYAVDHDRTIDGNVGYAVKVKTSGQHLDLLKMAYPMAHPSMNRRHKFRFEEVTPKVPSSFVYGYGCPVSYESEMKNFFSRNGMKFDKILCFDMISGLNAEQIIDLICKEK